MPAEINELIKQVLYALWDIGFKVGHSTRSICEACEHANEDNVCKTALVESRYLAGPRALFVEFQQRFEEACVRGQEASYLAWRLEDQRVRHQKYGPTVFLQEPNIKSSPGGLRDYHNLLWSLYFKERRAQPRRAFPAAPHQRKRAPHPGARLRLSATRPHGPALPHAPVYRYPYSQFRGPSRRPLPLPREKHAASQRGVHAGLLSPRPGDLAHHGEPFPAPDPGRSDHA